MTALESLTYRLDLFEGPLDLLLTLIQKNKFDISDIPIAVICDQYMDYINAAEDIDLDVSADFIVMASRLMLIKSKMLLPKLSEDEEDPRAELAAAVLEYARAKEASQLFAGMYSLHSGRMVKDTDEIEPDRTLRPHSADLLTSALMKILSETKTIERAETRFTPLIKKRSASASEKAIGIIRHLYRNGTTKASYLLGRETDRSDRIAVFLAILELLRNQRLLISGGIGEDGTISTDELSFELSIEHARDKKKDE